MKCLVEYERNVYLHGFSVYQMALLSSLKVLKLTAYNDYFNHNIEFSKTIPRQFLYQFKLLNIINFFYNEEFDPGSG